MQEIVARLYLAQRGRCFHCLGPMLLSAAARKITTGKYNDGWTRDHIIPRSKGGVRAHANVALAHMKCNGTRGNTDPTPEMIERQQKLYAAALAYPPKKVKQILFDPALRGTYLAVFDYLTPPDANLT